MKKRQFLSHAIRSTALMTLGVQAPRANSSIQPTQNLRSAQANALHLLNRLGFGPRPGEIEHVASNPQLWIEEQLSPAKNRIPTTLTAKLNEDRFKGIDIAQVAREFGVLISQNQQLTAQQAAQQQMVQDPTSPAGLLGVTTQNQNVQPVPPTIAAYVSSYQGPAIASRLLRAIESPNQLEEVMVDFWFNHFNIFQGKNLMRVMVGHYEQYAIRPFVLGRFKDLLTATAHHPAMLYYLDNAQSVAPNPGRSSRGLNENYARELMELHTLGVDAGYTQRDVTELARMLTGWSIAPLRRNTRENSSINPVGLDANGLTAHLPGRADTMPGFLFNERVHDQGEKFWLGQKISPNGKSEGDFALDFLAKHPGTARHICFKLAQYFVSDLPSSHLVNRLANVFAQTDGQIAPVLRAIFTSHEFWAQEHVATKFKTPYHYVISVLRATDANLKNVQPIAGALANLGMPLFGCPTPDGYKNTETAWLNPDGLTKRINFCAQVAQGRLGAQNIGLNVRTSELIKNLAPIITPALSLTVEKQSDPVLASALVLASPGMMYR
jgi:uncharacterized protein (DUF1800 family)